MNRLFVSLLPAFLLALAWGIPLQARSNSETFLSLDVFLREVSAARFVDYEARKESRVEQETEFERMRRYILSFYEGVTAGHSFQAESQVFDCIPVERQPAVRQLGLDKLVLEPPEAVPQPPAEGGGAREVKVLAAPPALDLTDPFGNVMSCEEGAIPLRRITLEEMTGFGSLEGFFRKTPAGEEVVLPKPTPRYARAWQSVKNFGGSSWLNLWSPSVHGSTPQLFSTSQQWYSGGNGKGFQAVEGGWQVYPGKYQTHKSVLFIYWTADNYNKTGCYNLDCIAFVQTSSKWFLGAPWPNYSRRGGAQWEIQMQWKLTGGNWWLFLEGHRSLEPVGYYPGSIFRGGQLSRHATRVDFGGQAVGAGSWSPMGSGAFAQQGFRQAAYQRKIFYIDSTATGRWTSLKALQPTPKCYTVRYTPFSLGRSWGSFFYFGGPGGRC